MENADLPECERDAKRSLFLLLASVILGPFTLVPAIIYAHRARRNTAIIRRGRTVVTLVIGYSVCAYSLVAIGFFLLPPKTIAEGPPTTPTGYREVGEKLSSPTSETH